MNILVYKDGRIVAKEAGEPINEGLEGLIALISNPQEGQVLTFNGEIWVNAALPEPEETKETAEG